MKRYEEFPEPIRMRDFALAAVMVVILTPVAWIIQIVKRMRKP